MNDRTTAERGKFMLSEDILNFIKELYHDGLTQDEIAKKLNTDQQTVNRLLSGKRRVSGLTINTFEKMFPRAEIFLQGSQISGNNSVNIQGGVNTSSDLTDKILNSDDLSAEEKIKMLKVLKK